MAEINPADDEHRDEIDESMMDQARAMAAQIGDPFTVLRAAIELFTAAPSESLTDAALSADVIRLRAQIGRLEAIFAEYTLGSHRRGLCGHDAMRSTPAWLAWQTGLARGQVRRAIDTAELAELLPTIGAAWRDGRVSTNAMEAIAAARVPGHDENLAACEDEFTTWPVVVTTKEYAAPRKRSNTSPAPMARCRSNLTVSVSPKC